MELRDFLVSGSSPETDSSTSQCNPIYLPAGGIINIPGQDPITLGADAAFQPECTQGPSPMTIVNRGLILKGTSESDVTNIAYSDFRDPFYGSTFPQCYALSATTVIAYTLAIILFITPRSFVDGGVVVLGRQGFTSGGTGGTNIGGRPWLQKVAATFVAVSLTIATVDTFRVAEQQYSEGIQNAEVLQQDVLEGTELKVIRIISAAFLWLAQAQTLIRLFPRQREKVIIKWTAFALIGLGVIFDSLNSFMYTNQGSLRPRSFTDAIPALSYLFQLSLGVLYAAWVVYYSLMKKHYAYYHPQMRNMCLVALLSVSAVLVPIVFFILDIIKPDFTGWGDYVRWVGGAAASVIVWEWVERIEALEREEKKDGILGREVFDGDEMLDVSAPDFSWSRKRKNSKRDDGASGDGGEDGESRPRSTRSSVPKHNAWPIVSSIATRYRQRSRSRTGDEPRNHGSGARTANIRFLQPPLWPARPPPVATPVSRTDTASADSTVYAVRYHPVSETSGTNTEPFPESRATPLPAVVPEVQEPGAGRDSSESHHEERIEDVDRASAATVEPSVTPSQSASQVADRSIQSASQPGNRPASQTASRSSNYRLQALSQASQLLREASKPNTSTEGSQTASGPRSQGSSSGRWNFKSRFEEFAVSQAERLRDRMRTEVDTESLPVTVIPAPPRRGAAMQQLRDEDEETLRANTLAPPRLRIQTSSNALTGHSHPSPPGSGYGHSGASTAAAAVTPLTSQGSSRQPSHDPLLRQETEPAPADVGHPGPPTSSAAVGKRPAVGPNDV